MNVLQLSTVIFNMHGHNGDVEGFLHVVRVADNGLAPRVAVPRVLVNFQGTLGSNQADKPRHFAVIEEDGEGRGEERERRKRS